MEKKKKEDLDIFEGDILEDNDALINDALINDVLNDLSFSDGPKAILSVGSDYISGLAAEAEGRLKNRIITDPGEIPPSQVLKSNINSVVNINVKPGSSLSSAIANPAENDNLLAVIRDNKSTSTILKAIMEEIAEEAAYIKAWRNDNWNTGEDFSEATFKRIKMLKHLVETIVEQEKLKKSSVSGKVDFHGEAFQRVLKYFLETIQKVFRKVHIPEQFEDIFFTELAKAFDSFEKSAERLYYGKD